jgi:hypothetical protein
MRCMSIYFRPPLLATPNVLELDDASSHLLVSAPIAAACMLSFVASSYGRYLLDETSVAGHSGCYAIAITRQVWRSPHLCYAPRTG